MILQLFYKRLKKPILSKKSQGPSANLPLYGAGTLFHKKSCNLQKKLISSTCWRYQLEILIGWIKVCGIPGKMPKFEENTLISKIYLSISIKLSLILPNKTWPHDLLFTRRLLFHLAIGPMLLKWNWNEMIVLKR